MTTCCTLHNWLRMTLSKTYISLKSVDVENFNTGEVIPGIWRNEITNLLSIFSQGGSNHSINSEKIRDLYAEYFMNEGSVPWQWNLVEWRRLAMVLKMM